MNKTFVVRFLVTLMFSGAVWGQSAPSTKSIPERLGYPAGARLLVIHADDFGMAHSVNRAIEEAIEKKWVTSAAFSSLALGFRKSPAGPEHIPMPTWASILR